MPTNISYQTIDAQFQELIAKRPNRFSEPVRSNADIEDILTWKMANDI